MAGIFRITLGEQVVGTAPQSPYSPQLCIVLPSSVAASEVPLWEDMGNTTIGIRVPATLTPWLKAALAVALGENLLSTVALSGFAIAAAVIVLAMRKAPPVSTCPLAIAFTSTRWWPHFQSALAAMRAEQLAASPDEVENDPPSTVSFTLVELDLIFHGGSIAGPWGQWAVLGGGSEAEPEGEAGGVTTDGEPVHEQAPEQDDEVTQATLWAAQDVAGPSQAAGGSNIVLPPVATQQALAERKDEFVVFGREEVDLFGQVSDARKKARATVSVAVAPPEMKWQPRDGAPTASKPVAAAYAREQTALGGLASATRKRPCPEPEVNASQMTLMNARAAPARRHARSQGDAMVEETIIGFGIMQASGDELERAMITMRQSQAFLAARLAERDSASSSRASGSGSASGASQTGSTSLMRNFTQTKTERNKARRKDKDQDDEAGEDAGGQGEALRFCARLPLDHGGQEAAALLPPCRTYSTTRCLTDPHNLSKIKSEQSVGAGKGKKEGKEKDGADGSSGRPNGQAPKR